MAKNTESNVYTILFATGMVLVVGTLLAFLASSLKEKIAENKRIEKQQNILYAMGINENDESSVEFVSKNIVGKEFNKYITKQLVITGADAVENDKAYLINLKKETALAKSPNYQRRLPLFVGNKDGKESYPTSLRLINWIKFVSKHKIKDTVILQTMREDANRLYSNIEYHLLANHLLENAFALWFSAHFFKDHRYLKKATYLLKRELNEQILKDGAHFELSPMYHQLMLYRILDSINLAELNPFADTKTTSYLRLIATKMISWLNQITFESGHIPLFNDAANNINPSTYNLMYYAKKLNISVNKIELSESGFRKFKGKHHELLINVADIKPSYTPGHTHADTFNFELYVNNKPIIVDSGTSTYNICPEREYQRSTKAHNTVTICEKNSSQVWSGFRVAKRANVTMIIDEQNYVSATHNGYRSHKVLHKRSWRNKKDEIQIQDSLIGQKVLGKLFLHFHPNVQLIDNKNCFLINGNIEISFSKYQKIRLLNSSYCPEFNQSITKKTLEITFKNKITTTIKIN